MAGTWTEWQVIMLVGAIPEPADMALLIAGGLGLVVGVRRLSAGSSISEMMYGRVAALAAGFLRDGVSAPLLEAAMPYRDINALMAARDSCSRG